MAVEIFFMTKSLKKCVQKVGVDLLLASQATSLLHCAKNDQGMLELKLLV